MVPTRVASTYDALNLFKDCGHGKKSKARIGTRKLEVKEQAGRKELPVGQHILCKKEQVKYVVGELPR